MKKTYGIEVKARTSPQRPVKIDLSGKEGSRVVNTAAKRVIATHAHAIKALAKR